MKKNTGRDALLEQTGYPARAGFAFWEPIGPPFEWKSMILHTYGAARRPRFPPRIPNVFFNDFPTIFSPFWDD